MALAILAGATENSAVTGGAVTLTRPIGARNGDYLIAGIYSRDGAHTVIPTGWTKVPPAAYNTQVGYLDFYYKLVTDISTEAGSWTWSGGSGRQMGAMFILEGASPTALIMAVGNHQTAFSNPWRIIVPGVTTAAADAGLISLVGNNTTNGGDNPFTGPGSKVVSVHADSAGTGTDSTMEIFAEFVPAAGGTGSRTFSATSQSMNAGIGYMIAVTPGPVAPPETYWVYTAETGLPNGTALTLDNSDDGTAGARLNPTLAGGGAVEFSADNPLNGALSVAFRAPSPDDVARAALITLFSSNTLVFDITFSTPTYPSASVRFLEAMMGGTYGLRINLSSTGLLMVYNAANALLWTSPSAVSTNAAGWRLGFRVTNGTVGAGTLALSYYSTRGATTATFSMPAVTGGNFGTGLFDSLRIGKITDAPVWPVFYADDVQVSDNRATLFNSPATVVQQPAVSVDAGPDQTVSYGGTATLVSVSSGSPTSWSWVQTAGVSVSLVGTGATRTFTVPASSDTEVLTFTVTATNAGGSATDTVTVNVLPHLEWIMIGGVWVPTQSASFASPSTDILDYRTELDFTADYSTTANLIASYESIVSPETVTAVNSPTGDGTRMMMSVVPDTATGGVTQNPRMQAQTPDVILNGDEFWLFQDLVFPADFPVIGEFKGYVQTMQFYGQPFGGGATFTMTDRSDGTYDVGEDFLRWSPNRDNPQIQGLIWKHPITRGPKHRYAFRMKVTDSLDTGFVEIWYDNVGGPYVQQTLYGGVKRLPIILWGSVNNVGPGRTDAQSYRRVGEYDSITMFHGNHKIRGSLSG